MFVIFVNHFLSCDRRGDMILDFMVMLLFLLVLDFDIAFLCNFFESAASD